MPQKGGVLSPSRGRAELLDLGFLASVPFDTNYVKIQSLVIYECTLFRCGLCPNLESDICSVGLIKVFRASCDGPPWECATPEANLAEGCDYAFDRNSPVPA